MSRKRARGRIYWSALGIWALIASFAVVADTSAQSGVTRSLLKKIDSLERKVEDLERQVYRGETPQSRPASAAAGGRDADRRAAGVELRITALEDQLRAITGRLEESEHRVRQLETRHERLVGAMDARLRELEHGLEGLLAGRGPAAVDAEGTVGSGDATTVVSGATAVEPRAVDQAGGGTATAGLRTAPAAPRLIVLPDGTPRQQYDYAQALLRKSKFDAAEQAFSAFMELHPDNKLAPAANYWLGDTLFLRKAYEEAARVFLEGYQRFPKGAKANDTLLKLGLSLARLDQVEEACAMYRELLTRLPKRERRLRPRAERERRDNKCG